MISEIIKLKYNGFSIKQIAFELNVSVGKVHYQWNKYRKNQSKNLLGPHKKNDIYRWPKEEKDNRPRHCKNKIDQCTLMVQSPWSLFCYWELSTMKKNALAHHLNDEWCLFEKKIRLYDITAIFFNGHNAHRYQEFSLHEGCKQWFFYHLIPNRTYCVDIGVVTKEGSFFPLLRSNPIDTPRATPFETGLFSEAVLKWKEGKRNEPEWLEGFSSYSYYEKLK